MFITISYYCWNDLNFYFQERAELKLSSHGRKVKKFGRPASEIEGLVAACYLDIGDWGLIYAFAKRWHKETSSFHLLVGEVTITLDDMTSLLHLPITSAFHSFEAIQVDEVVDLLVDLLEVSLEEARAETLQWHIYMFDYPGCETFIVANVTQHSGL